MLPQFYIDYLKAYLPSSEFLILQILVWLLQVHQVLVTEEKRKERFNVVVYWKRKYNNKQLPNSWYLLTNLKNKEEVIKIFASRGGLEAMFRDCKSGGYNLEGSSANTQRLTNLI